MARFTQMAIVARRRPGKKTAQAEDFIRSARRGVAAAWAALESFEKSTREIDKQRPRSGPPSSSPSDYQHHRGAHAIDTASRAVTIPS
jgi:hypothetical protein